MNVYYLDVQGTLNLLLVFCSALWKPLMVLRFLLHRASCSCWVKVSSFSSLNFSEVLSHCPGINNSYWVPQHEHTGCFGEAELSRATLMHWTYLWRFSLIYNADNPWLTNYKPTLSNKKISIVDSSQLMIFFSSFFFPFYCLQNHSVVCC